MSNSKPATVAIIGCGLLGTSIARGILEPLDAEGFAVEKVIATVDTKTSQARVRRELASQESRLEVRLSGDNMQTAKEADIVVLAVKPVKRTTLFKTDGFRKALQNKRLIVSIMAGIKVEEINRLLEAGEGTGFLKHLAPQVVRVMPNMAADIRESVSLVTADQETIQRESLQTALWIFDQIGTSQFVDEAHFDISSVLVGCAGSLLLLAVDGLLDAAVAEGIKRSDAQKFVMDSALGMMKLVPAGNHPSVLREKIASPGGCSIRALLELEKRGVRSAFTDAIMVAAERSKEMSGT